MKIQNIDSATYCTSYINCNNRQCNILHTVQTYKIEDSATYCNSYINFNNIECNILQPGNHSTGKTASHCTVHTGLNTCWCKYLTHYCSQSLEHRDNAVLQEANSHNKYPIILCCIVHITIIPSIR